MPDLQPAIADPESEPWVSGPTVDSEPAAPKSAAHASLSTALTTAEKIVALAANACRWPHGDPQHPDFYFCSTPTAEPPYCPRHRTAAFLKLRPGRGHDARVGPATKRSTKSSFSYGRHGRPSIPGAFSATGASRAPKLDRAGDLPDSAPPPA
jgi:hypothetical protein